MPLTIAAALNNVSIHKRDTEILLAYILQVARSYLYAWPEKKLTAQQEKIFLELTARRKQGEPVAYITGFQEFWSLNLHVTSDTLIPRPETELLVEIALQKIPPFSNGRNFLIADLGTGSGAIALAIAHERRESIVHAVDQSAAALKVAKENAQHLQINNVLFHQGNWCQALPQIQFDAIVANPPYIAEDDIHLKDLSYEPSQALIAGKDGLDCIREIIHQSLHSLKPDGILLIEHGNDQAESVRKLFTLEGYHEISSYQDLTGWERVTGGRILSGPGSDSGLE